MIPGTYLFGAAGIAAVLGGGCIAVLGTDPANVVGWALVGLVGVFWIVLSFTRLPTSVELRGGTLVVRQMFSTRSIDVREVTRVISPRIGLVTIRANGQRTVAMVQPVWHLEDFFDAFEQAQPFVDIEQPWF